MYWQDEGYLLSKINYSENSVIIEVLTLNHGKYKGIVYGGTSRKIKKYLQIGNQIFLIWKSKREDKIGYFTTELIRPVSPLFFDNKMKITCISSASSIMRIILPERQINKKIYTLYENLINNLQNDTFIFSYIFWEFNIIKELGFEVSLPSVKLNDKANSKNYHISINDKSFLIPEFLITKKISNASKEQIKQALFLNKFLILENFLDHNNFKLPLSRYLLEKYFL